MVRQGQKYKSRMSKLSLYTFCYIEPFDHHYMYIVDVSNHNQMSRDSIRKHQVVFYNVCITQFINK